MIKILIALSAVFTVAAAFPYIIEIIKGKTRPRIVSWFTWSVLTGIACAASFVDKQYPGGILLLFATLETMAIVVLGWRYGDRKFERLDIACLTGAMVGLALWLIFNSPAVAVIAAIAVDVVGGIPTFKHIWRNPHEETWVTFAMMALGALCAVLAAWDWRITASAYPLYIVTINVLFVGAYLARYRYVVSGEPAELREL